jgi:hypothetical protein
MGTRPIKELVLGYIGEAWAGRTNSVVGSTPRYSRLKYTPLRLDNG